MSSWKKKIIKHIRSLPLSESEMSSAILTDSLPIISFGDFTKSSYLTLAINPSSVEYGDNRGLAQLSKFHLDSWVSLSDESLISDDQIYSIYEASSTYFDQGMKPYEWFDYPQITLKALGASYGHGLEDATLGKSHYEKRASHVDLTPWTTHDPWQDVDKDIQDKLIRHNSEFLLDQLTDESIEIILILGGQALNLFKKSLRTLDIAWKESEGTPFRVAKEAHEVTYKKVTFGARVAFFVSQGPSSRKAFSRNEQRRTSRTDREKKRQSRSERKEELEQIFEDFACYIKNNLNRRII